MKKNNLDERQEQTLLRIEHNTCWIAFWGLLIAMVVQLVTYGFDFARIGGEWLIFMALSLYLAYACMKNGIWDRRLKPDGKTNFIVSLIAGVAVGLVIGLAVWFRFDKELTTALISGAMVALLTFVLCFIALAISSKALKNRQKKLEAEEEEE